MEPNIQQVYEALRAKGVLSDTPLSAFAAKMAVPESRAQFAEALLGAKVQLDEPTLVFFGKKKVSAQPSPAESEPGFPDFTETSSSQNAPVPTAAEPSTFEPQFQADDQQPVPAESIAIDNTPQATDQNGFAALPGNLIPGGAPRDATAPASIVDRGEVKPYAISGGENITEYAKAKNPTSRRDSQQDVAPSMETTMSSGTGSEEAKAAMVYAEDARRQADIADQQLKSVYGEDWRKTAPQDDPDRIKFDTAIKAQSRAYDHYQAHTGGTELDGTEDPVAFGEHRRQNLPSYEYKKTYDSKTVLRGEKRQLDNIAEYGEAARFQTRFADTLLKAKYGEDWQAGLDAVRTAIDEGITPEQMPESAAEAFKIMSDPDFQKWQAGATAQNKGYEAFKAKIESSPAYQKRLLEAAASQSAANLASQERPGPESLGLLVNPSLAIGADQLSKNWMFRKGAQLIGAAASLPRTIGRGLSGAEGGWKVADEIASWADDFTDQVDVAYPKPEQMSRPLYERVTSFNGNEAVVDDKGKLLSIRGKDGQDIEITPENKKAFEESGAADKAREQFNGGVATADKVLDAAADLMIYRFMGGGTKTGVIASSFFMQHQKAYTEAAEEMKMSAGDAARYALVTSTLTGVLEAYLGNIETKFASPAVQAAVKAGKKEAMLLAGKASGADVAVTAMKPVIKEVVGENAEEFMQALSDSAVKSAYNNMTGAGMEAGISAQDMKETALVTTLLTAPAASLGLSAHVEANRRSALLAAVKDQQGFEAVIKEMEDSQAITPEKAVEMKQQIYRLSLLNKSLPNTMTDDERSHVLALQEFSDKKRAEATAENVAPAIATVAKEEAAEADKVIANMVRDEKADPTPAATTEPKPKKAKKGKKVAEVTVTPEDTPEVVEAKTEAVVSEAVAALEAKGHIVTPEELPAVQEFFVPTVTETPFVAEQEVPLAETVSALADEYLEDNSVPEGVGSWRKAFNEEPDPSKKGSILRAVAQTNTTSKEASDILDAAIGLPEESNIIWEVINKEANQVENIQQVLSSEHSDFTKENVRDFLKSNPDIAKQVEAYEAELPAISAKVEALSTQDMVDANAFVAEMGNDIDRVIASVNGAIEEMDRQAFEALRAKNPTVHQLFFDELTTNEVPGEVPDSGQGQKVSVRPAKAAQAPAVNQGQEDAPGVQVERKEVAGLEDAGESDTGGIELPEVSTTEGAMAAVEAGLITPSDAVQAISEVPDAMEKVVAAGPLVEAAAETEVDIQDAVEGAEYQALMEPDGGLTPLSAGIFVTRGDVVYVANSTGFEDILRDMGGNLVPGKGWAFPLADKWKVAAAMKRTAIASARDRAARKNSGDEGRTSAAMGDKDVLVTAKKTEKAIAEGKTLEERVAAAKGALHVQEDERKKSVLRTIERLQKAFPGIEVVTDKEAIKDVLHKLGIKDAPAGFTYEGKVYIDMEMAGIDTPIHEFGHIWSTFLKVNKPKLHAQGLAAVKGTEYEAVVREDERYGYLEDEADVLDEALSQAIGERGARLGEQSDWEAFKSFMAKAKTAIKNALGFDPMKMSAKQYADTMAAKMLSGEVLMEETSADIAKLENGVKFLFAGKEATVVSKEAKMDLDAARYMESAGHSPHNIWHSTNWWRGPDGHWRWEVSDKGSEVIVEPMLIATGEVRALDSVMSHPELYKIYPPIKDVPVIFQEADADWSAKAAVSKSGTNYFVINTRVLKTKEQIRKALLHEVQHSIQHAEGFGAGMQTDQHFVNTVVTDNLTTAVMEKDMSRLENLYDARFATVGEIYRRASGEVEARNVESRADLDERVFPETTMDVAPAEQLVLFMTDGAFDKIVHGFDGSQAAPKAKFQHAGNTLREASLRAAAAQLVDIEVRSGGTPRATAVPFIATELGLDEALVDQMWEDAAHKHTPKNMIDTTKAGISKSVSAITTKLGKWANKWVHTYRNLPKEVFRATVDMQRQISAEMYRASKLGNDLSNALKKYPPEMAGVVQNVLEGNADWSLLPPDIAAPAMAVRESVDSLSRKLLLSGAIKKKVIVKVVDGVKVTKSNARTVMANMGIEIGPDETGLVDRIEDILAKPPLERTDEEVAEVDDFLDSHKAKMGTYLNRSYRAHQYKDWGLVTPDGFKRVPPEAVDQARKFFVKQLQEQYKKLVDSLAKKEEKMTKKVAKIEKLIEDGQNALLQPNLDPAEVLSRSAEIGELQIKMEALEKEILTDREATAKKMDDVSAQLGKIDDVIANYLYEQRTDSSTSPSDIAGKKNESVLSKREDVPEELRALLGEYRDPVVNYATTVAKVAHLMAAQNFLNTMRSRYGGIYFHEGHNSPPGNYVQVSMDNDPAFGPIDGWWTTPDIMEGLKGMRSPAVVSAWEKNWAVYFVQRVKLGKTIGSPITHVRNFMGNIAFAVMNGWNPVTMYTAFKDMAPMFNDGDRSAWRAYAEKMHRLGVFGESVNAGDLEALRTYASWDKGKNEVARYATFVEKLMSSPSKIYDVAKKAYESEDNFYRMMSFENEKRRYARAYYNKPFSELDAAETERVEARAAEIVSHILPTYSYVPELVQAIRRLPFVGTFVAFPSEMIRVAYNNLELATQELKDTRTRSLGARRLMGAALVHSAEFWLLELAKSWAGYDDEEWENANSFVPPFEKNGALIPLKRDGKGQMGYINMSYTNPYSFIPKAWRAFSDDPSASVAKSTVAAVGSLASPFVSPELSMMSMMQLFMNQDDWGRPIRQDAFEGPLGSTWLAGENVDAQMRFLANKLQPGIVRSVRDAYDISQSNPSRSGKVKDWETFALSHSLGLSIQRIDPTFSYGNQMYKLTDQKNQARKNYTAAQKRYNKGYQTVLDENPNDTLLLNRKDAEFKALMKEEYEVSKTAYARILQDAVEITQALRALGVSEGAIKQNMGGFSNAEKAAIMSGKTNLQLTFKRKGRY